jgi:5-formaminoimidazole-4-carboxamide-1-(beta)-D-ribofuranosyl 5'-monophosphate synthetase
MITQKDIKEILKDYDPTDITIAVLGGHSALDVCSGAKEYGFKTLAVCKKGREKTYAKYYKTREDGRGCIDEVLLVDEFSDIVKEDVQKKLRDMNAIFIHNRYFWVYFKDFKDIEEKFMVPIYGIREGVKLEERDVPKNQYYLLEKAGIQLPKIVREGDSGMNEDDTRKVLDEHFDAKGGPLIIKVNEAIRSYERAFFVITNTEQYFETSSKMIEDGKIMADDLANSVVEEFIIGAQINFNYFYSNLTDELEIMGTDTRRQTSLDGFLRLDAQTQTALIDAGYKPSMVETGHIACTTKESILEKAFEAGEKFVEMMKKEVPPGMIGPFALQGAIAAYEGKEEFVCFDVSMRIPGSPGTRFTPATSYLYGDSISYGERIAMEVHYALEENRLAEILT